MGRSAIRSPRRRERAPPMTFQCRAGGHFREDLHACDASGISRFGPIACRIRPAAMPRGVPGADTVCRVSPGVVDWHHPEIRTRCTYFMSSRRRDQGREAYGRKLYCTRVCRILVATHHWSGFLVLWRGQPLPAENNRCWPNARRCRRPGRNKTRSSNPEI